MLINFSILRSSKLTNSSRSAWNKLHLSHFFLVYLLSTKDNLFPMHEATIPYQRLTWNVLFCTHFTLKWLIQSQEAFKQIAKLQPWLSDNNETRHLKTLILFLPHTQADTPLRSFHICLPLWSCKRHSSSETTTLMRFLLGLQYIFLLGPFGHSYSPNYSSPN